jgi:hypothetical protein
MTMCEHDKEQYTRLLTEELSGERKVELENQLAQCAECRTAFRSMQKVWGLTEEVLQPEPPATLRTNFYSLLEEYKKEEATKFSLKEKTKSFFELLWPSQPKFQFAFTVLFLALGISVGLLINRNSGGNEQVADLSGQVKEMREMLMLSLLENPSASERMRAVSLVTETKSVNRKVAEALLTTLNNDENVNVRLSTLEVLSNLSNDPYVRKGLVESILHQESPLVQDALADVMVKLQDKRAVKPLQKILKDENTNEIIKTKIRESLHKLT